MRRIIKQVHPDLFTEFQVQRTQNSESLKVGRRGRALLLRPGLIDDVTVGTMRACMHAVGRHAGAGGRPPPANDVADAGAHRPRPAPAPAP